MLEAHLREDEKERLDILRSYEVMDSLPERPFDEITQRAAAICGTSFAVMTLLDDTRQWVKSSYGLCFSETPRNIAFCDYTIRQKEVFVVEDALQDERFKGNPMVLGEPRIRFYAGHPLRTSDGVALGALAVLDSQPREFTAEQRLTLTLLSGLLMDQLELRVQRLKLERALAEKELLQMELARRAEHLTDAQRIARLGSWQVDIKEGRLKWTEEVFRIMGVGREDFGGTVEWFYEKVLHPEDRERVKQARKQAMEAGTRFDIEHRVLRPGGGVRHVHERAEILRDASGQPLAIAGTVQDVTKSVNARQELKQSEQRLRMILDSLPMAAYTCDENGLITYFNEQAREVWGRSPMLKHPDERFCGGHRIFDITGNRLRPEECWMAVALREERAIRGKELLIERPDGSRRHVLVHVNPLNDAEDRLVGAVNVLMDVTEKKKLEAHFLRAQRMESIGTLAGGIAHDLNNVLSPILMSIDLLRLKAADAQTETILSTIETSARRGADMVKQVLSFARGMEGRRVQIQVSEVVRDIRQIVDETFPKNILFQSAVPGGLPVFQGDPTHVHQVLLNLCVNARDAMPDGGVLEVSAEEISVDDHYAAMNPDTTPGHYLALKVADSGVGIAKQDLDKIFDPFFTTKELGKGTGLGLSTVMAIVKSHGGFLQVDSQPGVGTQIRAHFPVNQDAAHETVIPEEGGLPPGQGELILVVDDEEAVRNITGQTLQAYGYSVLTAADGAEAVALYARHQKEVRLVLTDMMMPVMDGTATIQVLRRMNAGVPIIAASGLNRASGADQAVALGINHFLPKPYNARTLLTTLREILIATAPAPAPSGLLGPTGGSQ